MVVVVKVEGIIFTHDSVPHHINQDFDIDEFIVKTVKHLVFGNLL